jgi:hypothetical protein
MGKRRMALLSDEEKSQLDKLAAKARKKKLSPEERTEIARKTGKAGGRDGSDDADERERSHNYDAAAGFVARVTVLRCFQASLKLLSRRRLFYG